jgi:hypothetical protein
VFIASESIKRSFFRLKEKEVNAKVGMERTTSLFRFLAFDMLCRIENENELDFSPDSALRKDLIGCYKKIAMDPETGYEVCNLGQILKKPRGPESRIGNDFLTAQLKDANSAKNSRSYPSRPAPLLTLGLGASYWNISRAPDWPENFLRFLEDRVSATPCTDLIIFLARAIDFPQDLKSIEEAADFALSNMFSMDLTNWLKQRIIDENGPEGLLLSWQPTPVSFLELDDTASSYSINDSDEELSLICRSFVQDANLAGLLFSLDLSTRYAASLLCKRFLILSGLAGSGKTKLAQAFSRWISNDASAESGLALVAVGADWVGNDSVLGYPYGLDESSYVTKPAIDLLLRALERPQLPHFLILDEMNLSHVERYFADILSAIESGEPLCLYRGKERKANDAIIPTELELPKNLFIIGTVNVDETTYMFSPKVLDRANVIEFHMAADELQSFLSSPVKPELSRLDGKGIAFGAAFVEAAKGDAAVPADAKEAFQEEMLLFFKVLQVCSSEFGYRVAHESARFVYFYKLLGNCPDDGTWFSAAFDCVLVQKFLPKLHGSRAKLGPLLKMLWFLCVNNVADRGDDALKAAMAAAASTDKNSEPSADIPPEAPYPVSAEKIARMWRLLRDNGFTSFAEA